MSPQVGILCLLLFCVCMDNAKAHVEAEKEHSGVSPAVKQKDAKFFGKDYPYDKRPPVDVFHFKHPYPVVQDSNDFDNDFVKDENSDDGSWHAQSEYDRLRHKLAKEKEEVAKAFAAKSQAEKELQEAMKREEVAKKKVELKRKQPQVQGSKGMPTPVKEPEEKKPPSPGGIASPGDVRVATSDTQKAMDALEECKKQLAKARENLKKLLKELEEAKKLQKETQAAYEAAAALEKDSERTRERGKVSVKSDYQQYLDAREDYLRQQALVAKMDADLKVAAAKVKEIRGEEDKGGGVYNSGDKDSRNPFKSFAPPSGSPWLAVAVAGFATVFRFAH